jgi:Cof subfamily protein (haloacid dehalogenase superfamily)
VGPVRPPRVVATDLDGTLLRSDGSLSERTVRTLEMAQSSGARVVVVTARPPRHVARVLGSTRWSDALAICSNGAIVYDLSGGRVVSAEVVAPEAAALIASALSVSSPDVAWAVETGLELVSGPGWGHTFTGETAHDKQLDDLAELWSYPLVKVLAWSGRRSADEMLSLVRSLEPDGVEATHSGGPGIIELSAPGVTKARTLAALCERWAVDAREVVAFGDMPNDVPMLSWAGRSWAVAGAHPDALARATHIAGGNDDDGVAVVLEELFEGSSL